MNVLTHWLVCMSISTKTARLQETFKNKYIKYKAFNGYVLGMRSHAPKLMRGQKGQYSWWEVRRANNVDERSEGPIMLMRGQKGQ